MANYNITQHRLKFGIILSIVLTVLLSNSCSVFHPVQTLTPKLGQLSWQKRLIQLAEYKHWSLHGALNLKYYSKNAIVSFYWQQNKNAYDISLFGPLNLMRIYITGDNKKVTLWRSAQEKITAKTAETLLYRQVGWSIPISNLVYWIKGMPVANIPYKLQLDKYNHLTFLEQQGWSIEYSQFHSFSGVDLPMRIDLKNKNIKIRIAIKNWSTLTI